jgi:hypothetical protein
MQAVSATFFGYAKCENQSALLISRFPCEARASLKSFALCDGGIETGRHGGGTAPAGLLPDMAIEQREVALVPGDTVVIFSDGLSESQNESGEEFGDERLVSLLRFAKEDAAQRALAATGSSIR